MHRLHSTRRDTPKVRLLARENHHQREHFAVHSYNNHHCHMVEVASGTHGRARTVEVCVAEATPRWRLGSVIRSNLNPISSRLTIRQGSKTR